MCMVYTRASSDTILDYLLIFEAGNLGIVVGLAQAAANFLHTHKVSITCMVQYFNIRL